jgi:predicted ferric reductase
VPGDAPGQFLFLRPAVPDEEHPFSIASSPSPGGLIRLTIKDSGDFAAAVAAMKPGDLATVHGPFGRFSHVFHPGAAELVFVAAGGLGRPGRLDAESLRSLCGRFAGKTFYICGPPAMASALIHGLRAAGVGPERIRADHFGF